MYMFGSGTANNLAYVRFDLSNINIFTVVNASFKVTTSGGAPRNDALNVGRFALHGLHNIAGNTDQNWNEATLNQSNTGLEVNWTTRALDFAKVTDLDSNANSGVVGPTGMTETYVQIGNYWDPGNTMTVVGAPLVSFLQSRVNDNGLVTFIINSEITNSRGCHCGLSSRINTDLSSRCCRQSAAGKW
jgi:hypothetical protein